MLDQLTVRNFIVVEHLTLHFKSGMTSLTGETGAGKSILVDALSLALGSRSQENMIRVGHDRAEIEVSFDTSANSALQNWLIEHELDNETQCQLRRTINRNGPSKAYINGRNVPVNMLKEVSVRTIDIHGQNAHQSLLRPKTQRELLDNIADNKSLLEKLKKHYHEWRELKVQLDDIQHHAEEKTARLELLKYQVHELEALELTTENIKDLLQEQNQLSHSAQLTTTAEAAIHRIFDAEPSNAYQQLTQSLRELDGLINIEPQFNEVVETLNTAIINVDESLSTLRHYLDHNEQNPARLAEVEQQISQMHTLSRKHQVEIEQLPELYKALTDELSQLDHLEANSEALSQSVNEKEVICKQLSQKLSQRRISAAKPLADQISASIHQLAIPKGKINIAVTPLDENQISETGSDKVQFLVSTNPGLPMDDLSKVASGGELARISLAIQVVTAEQSIVPTLIFDEVDVGIGGGVAEIVGQHLQELGEKQQILCITHLPQVAARAHHQLHVNKQQDQETTINVSELTQQRRIEEIARMLGGVNITEKTRDHAEEMLTNAQI